MAVIYNITAAIQDAFQRYWNYDESQTEKTLMADLCLASQRVKDCLNSGSDLNEVNFWLGQVGELQRQLHMLVNQGRN
jgi:hypothetical protein